MSNRVCSVENCDRHHEARGYCKMHWKRWRRHGDPLLGTNTERTPQGAARQYLIDVVFAYEGTECLEWPFSKDGDGYARIRGSRKKMDRVARVLCQREYGPAPTPKHEAAHSCGNCWCITQAHVSWKTPVENAADKIIHGTSPRGENCGTAKLSRSQVLEIRALAGVVQRKAMATKFGVTYATIKAVEDRKTWAWLETAA